MKKIFGLLTLVVVLGSAVPTFAGDSGLLGKRYFSTGYVLGIVDRADRSTNTVSIGGNFPVNDNVDLLISGSCSWYEETLYSFGFKGNNFYFFSEDVKINVKTLMADIIYHFSKNSFFTPYIGVGLGFVIFDVDGDGDWGSDVMHSFEGLGGVQFEVSKKAVLDFVGGVAVIDSSSSGIISSEFGYWFTKEFFLGVGVGYNFNDDITACGISGNFLI